MCLKSDLTSVSHILKPIGNCPFTLSKLSAGTIKHFFSFALKKFLKPINRGDCNAFSVENSPILQPEIS